MNSTLPNLKFENNGYLFEKKSDFRKEICKHKIDFITSNNKRTIVKIYQSKDF